ncbi:serine aminopeptidase domain-containing protein [Maribacter algarum]|uniref:alpha/beta hydrolase family protein n=1 Tax=Maribacter algarum (ex Zhang et al. 2020) TaxID=2578118 RepID=UPI001485E71A|nr:alpha/beta hydrolase [Maribacter algarum]
MEVQKKELSIQTANGKPIAVTKFFSKNSINQVIVISSATGVLQKYYSHFADFCASKGIVVYTFDYGGIGKSISSLVELKKHVENLTSWGKNDQAAVVAFAKEENLDATLSLITHSVGGQIFGFNPNHLLIDKVIMIASQSGYWKDFEGFHGIKMWLFWYVIIPTLTPLFGYFPSKKLGLFENLPKNMVFEWASWGKKKDYLMHFKNESDYLFEDIRIPILAWSFPKDSFAPKKTVDWLANQYVNSQVTRIHYPAENQKQPGHFGFFKRSFKELLWEKNLNWILTNNLL